MRKSTILLFSLAAGVESTPPGMRGSSKTQALIKHLTWYDELSTIVSADKVKGPKGPRGKWGKLK